jgi:hypothetical protein
MERLAEIEADLATRQSEYEQAADDRARLVRDWDRRLAIHMRTAKGPNSESRKAAALGAAIDQDDLYERLTDAEGRFEALRVVMRTLETRATIGQSLLRAQGRGA